MVMSHFYLPLPRLSIPYAPLRVLTNRELEKMVDTTDTWIRTHTGILERRIAAERDSTSDIAVQAARAAMEQAEVPPEEIDLIIRKVRPKTNVFRRSTAGWDDVQ